MVKYIFILFTLNLSIGFCQEASSDIDLLNRAELQIYHNPSEAITIASYLLQNSQSKQNILEARMVLGQAYYIQGNFDESLNALLGFPSPNNAMEQRLAIKITLLIADIYRELGLYGLNDAYLKKAQLYASKIPDIEASFALGKIYQDSIGYYKETQDSLKTFLYLNKAVALKNQDSLVAFRENLHNPNIDMAEWYLDRFKLDDAKKFTDKAHQASEKLAPGNFLEMQSQRLYGEIAFLRASYNSALDSLKSAAKIAASLSNLGMQTLIQEQMAAVYLAMENTEAFQDNLQLSKALQLEIGNPRKQVINTIYKQLSQENQTELSKLDEEQSAIQNWFIITIIGFFILLTLILLRYRLKLKQYRLFQTYLDQQSSKKLQKVQPKKTVKRTMSIPKETEKTIIQQLESFEEAQEYLDNDVSLGQLAAKCNTNTKYLSEVINNLKGKNFNGYINELRLDYIIDKLRTNPTYRQYKVSYLAEESGFSSHSSFATVFKSVTGISPTTFINLLNKKAERKEVESEV